MKNCKKIALLLALMLSLEFALTACIKIREDSSTGGGTSVSDSGGTSVSGGDSSSTGGDSSSTGGDSSSSGGEVTPEPEPEPEPEKPAYEIKGSVITVNKATELRFEAEEADLTKYVKSGDNPTNVVERADASGGKFLAAATGDTNKKACFEFKINLAFDSRLTMKAAYAQPEKKKANEMNIPDTYLYTIDGSASLVVSASKTKLAAREDVTQWEVFGYDAIALKAGEHTVSVTVVKNTGKGNPNIDYLDLTFSEKAKPVTDPAVSAYEIKSNIITVNKVTGLRFEAEDADLTHYKKSGDNPTNVVERADASGGKFLAAATGNVVEGQYFEFKINLAYDARVTMKVAYVQTKQRKSVEQNIPDTYLYTIDDGVSFSVSEGKTKLAARDDVTKWEVFDYDAVTLAAGEHTVRVKVAANTGKGNPNIDYLEFNFVEA